MNISNEDYDRLRYQLEETKARLMNALMLNNEMLMEIRDLKHGLKRERSKKELLKHLSWGISMKTLLQFA